jgi:hypothetical protein
MTREPDLEKRLREYARNCGGPPEEYLAWQAADEIERLRTQCGGNCRYWEGRYRDEKAEVEQLQAQLTQCASTITCMGQICAAIW